MAPLPASQLILLFAIYISVLIAFLTNLFVLFAILCNKHARKVSNAFPLSMIIADLLSVLNETAVISLISRFYWPPAFVCVFQRFGMTAFFMVTWLSFYCYAMLRFFVIVYPLKCRLHLRNWHVYGTIIFIWIYSMILEASDFFALRSFLFETYPISCLYLVVVQMQDQPLAFTILKHSNNVLLFILFCLTIALIVVMHRHLTNDGPTNSANTQKQKQKAIWTIVICFVIFTTFHFSTYFFSYMHKIAEYYNYTTPNSFDTVLYFMRIIGLASNPLLYYKAKNADKSPKPSMASQTTLTTMHNLSAKSVTASPEKNVA